MTLKKALATISDSMYDTYEELCDGLPEGPNPDWGYDEQLVLEIAEAVARWQGRQRAIKEPFVVWYFDGTDWSVISKKENYREEIYKEWYALTKGGTVQFDASCETYYFLGEPNLELNGRHDLSEMKEEDDFSVGYLLNKSFG